MLNFEGRIKVKGSIKPSPVKDRMKPSLYVGQPYYVCFGNNNAYPCELIEVINEFAETEVRIKIPQKSRSKKGFIDREGNRTQIGSSTHILYANEIGLTPEDAVKNTVRN